MDALISSNPVPAPPLEENAEKGESLATPQVSESNQFDACSKIVPSIESEDDLSDNVAEPATANEDTQDVCPNRKANVCGETSEVLLQHVGGVSLLHPCEASTPHAEINAIEAHAASNDENKLFIAEDLEVGCRIFWL